MKQIYGNGHHVMIKHKKVIIDGVPLDVKLKGGISNVVLEVENAKILSPEDEEYVSKGINIFSNIFSNWFKVVVEDNSEEYDENAPAKINIGHNSIILNGNEVIVNGEKFYVAKKTRTNNSSDSTSNSTSTNKGEGSTQEISILSGSLNNLFNINIPPKTREDHSDNESENTQENSKGF